VNLDSFLTHMYGQKASRREAMRRAARLGGAAGAAAAFGATAPMLDHEAVSAAQQFQHREFDPNALQPEAINDDIFDVAAVEAGAWAPGPYGAGDQRGTLNEITPAKVAAALALIDTRRPVTTYNLGEMMFGGFPAFPSMPPRLWEQTLAVGAWPAPEGTIQLGAPPFEPIGPNRATYLEERLSTTYQIATQFDNLNHLGLGKMYYNGFTLDQLIAPRGTTALGIENVGPIVTRGIVLDIVGLKVSEGATSAYFTASNGSRVLIDNYRITVADIENAMRRQGLSAITPGDVVLFNEGWTHLVRSDPQRYLVQEPGIYLSEARYLAQFRPAMIGSDTWGLENLDPVVTGGYAFPVHQTLLMRYGIRIGEGIVTQELVDDEVFEFVYLYIPMNAPGATAGNTPPAALGQRRA
jgi:hypothetical protein